MLLSRTSGIGKDLHAAWSSEGWPGLDYLFFLANSTVSVDVALVVAFR